jgi:hypothetical protein
MKKSKEKKNTEKNYRYKEGRRRDSYRKNNN